MIDIASLARAASGPAQVSDAATVPLVIDLDGTLIGGDLLHESVIRLLLAQPATIFEMPRWLLRGKAHFKDQVASRTELEAENLPYQVDLVGWIMSERAAGRRVILCTASDRRLADRVAEASGLFDDVMASDGVVNLSAHRKADALVARFGRQGFDYAGNSRADVAVWSAARRAILVNASPGVRDAATDVAEVEREFAPRARSLRVWLKALRAHQWVKNFLVLLPLFGAHQFTDVPALISVALAFVAFSLCASSVYVVNDMVDLDADRRHPRKCNRPFAAGLLGVPAGLAVAVLLLAAAFAIAASAVNLLFTAWLAVYLVLTACYSLWLKRKMLVDSLVLAALYTLRLLAGAAAAGTSNGFWLLAFSLFLFLSLALVKRYSELMDTFRRGRARTPGRDYQVTDLPLVETLGVASGFSCVLVLAFYINGDTVGRLYKHEQVIWLTVPVLLYWISRMWLKAHRGELTDDPVVFALSDNLSRVLIMLFFAALLLASVP